MPSTVSSSCFSVISLALGAKRLAKRMTSEGKVAENKTHWMSLLSILSRVRTENRMIADARSYPRTRWHWSLSPPKSNMLSASSRTRILTPRGLSCRRRMTSCMVPGVPTTTGAVIWRPRASFSAGMAMSTVRPSSVLPISRITPAICRASSRVGARMIAWGVLSI